MGLRPLQAMMMAPAALFLAALAAMLLRHSGRAFLRNRSRGIRIAGAGECGTSGRDAAAVAGDGAGDVADDRADASGGRERDRATVR